MASIEINPDLGGYVPANTAQTLHNAGIGANTAIAAVQTAATLASDATGSQKVSAAGGLAGSVIGGIVGGPIGAAIGGFIGGFAGKLFGGGQGRQTIAAEITENNGRFGVGIVANKDASNSQARKLGEIFTGALNSLADTFGFEYKKPIDNIEANIGSKDPGIKLKYNSRQIKVTNDPNDLQSAVKFVLDKEGIDVNTLQAPQKEKMLQNKEDVKELPEAELEKPVTNQITNDPFSRLQMKNAVQAGSTALLFIGVLFIMFKKG